MRFKVIEYLKNLASRQKLIIEKQKELQAITQENVWANIYHDSIRGYEHLQSLPLNIGRWAGNYSFFYLLHRVLKDFKPNNVLDLGLGESSKFISTYIENYLPETNHTIGEHNDDWIAFVQKNFNLSPNSKIEKLELEKKTINNFEVNAFKNFTNKFNHFYDLIVIDAPFGSPRFSRYDIISYIEKTKFDKDFVIILDDTNRKGEQDTLEIIIEKLKQQRPDVFFSNYVGAKTCTIITNVKFLLSM